MTKTFTIGSKEIGSGRPVYVIAEIGLNHNGSLEIAKKLIDVAKDAGCDAVKFQKRTPDLCVPENVKSVMRETPWGYIPYIEYRHKVEFGQDEYQAIDQYCRQQDIHWMASCWDIPSVDFIEKFNTPAYKVASATLTDRDLLLKLKETGRAIILSTGMTSMEQIKKAVSLIDLEKVLITHCTSTYPCPKEELNLRTIQTLQKEFACPIGYSGHETGLATTIAAVALGACLIERHITLDRSMWGSDHSASIEPGGLKRLVKDIRNLELALGDGVKRVYESEKPLMNKLRLRDTL